MSAFSKASSLWPTRWTPHASAPPVWGTSLAAHAPDPLNHPTPTRTQAALLHRVRLSPFAVVLTAVLLFAAATSHAVRFLINDAAEFSLIVHTNDVLRSNAPIHSWLEGPAWIPSDGGFLVFCDQGNNRLKKLVPPGTVTDFLVPPSNTLHNGTVLDAHERLLACQAGSAGLRVVMITNGTTRGWLRPATD